MVVGICVSQRMNDPKENVAEGIPWRSVCSVRSSKVEK